MEWTELNRISSGNTKKITIPAKHVMIFKTFID
jgi:hypothetical protein